LEKPFTNFGEANSEPRRNARIPHQAAEQPRHGTAVERESDAAAAKGVCANRVRKDVYGRVRSLLAGRSIPASNWQPGVPNV